MHPNFMKQISLKKLGLLLLCSLTYFCFIVVQRPNNNLAFEHEFKPLNIGHDVVTFHNVCIEVDPRHENITVDVGVQVLRKIIHVYSSHRDEERKVKVRANNNRRSRGYYMIKFTKKERPASFTYIREYPAYFLIPSCTANLHHFWADGAEGLYNVMKRTNRIGSKVANQLYYKSPVIPTPHTSDCDNIHRYEQILYTFPIRQFHQTYHAEKHGTCYENAVFGWLEGNDHYKLTVEANQHILKGMNISYPQCGTGNRVTIIQRHQRRIINLEELMEASRLDDYNNTQTVTFEEMKLVDQMRAAYCTDVLVGIQGAGLRWIQYMRPHTAFLEFGWKNWPTKYYNRFGNYQDIKSTPMKIPDNNVFVNWTSYSLQVRQGKVVSDEERQRMLKRGAKDHRDNHWKWADVTVPLEMFLQNLKPLYEYSLRSAKE